MIPTLQAVKDALVDVPLDGIISLTLYGSVAYGCPDEDSDVDLLIFVYNEDPYEYDYGSLSGALKNAGFNPSLSLYNLTQVLAVFEPSPFWADVVHKGVTLHGSALAKLLPKVPYYTPKESAALRTQQYLSRAQETLDSIEILKNHEKAGSVFGSTLFFLSELAFFSTAAVGFSLDVRLSHTRTEPALSRIATTSQGATLVSNFKELAAAYQLSDTDFKEFTQSEQTHLETLARESFSLALALTS